MNYLILITGGVIIFYFVLNNRRRLKLSMRSLVEVERSCLANHVADLWSFIVNSPPVENIVDNEEDFRSVAIIKWLELEKRKITLEFGFIERPGMFGNYFRRPLNDSEEIKKINAQIKLSEEERKKLIWTCAQGINEILCDPSLQKHKALLDAVRCLAHEIQYLNPDLMDNKKWQKMCKKWKVVIRR